ncbi:hypothetical protein GJAV_G00085550 [Gymnothorax javanicus]|nr:hypothetical protein GJAV_G00085550 [Gymnothorax javanicus]
MVLLKQKVKKKNFSNREIEVLLEEVERRRYILLSGVSVGISRKRKRMEWQRVCAAVNAAGSANRTTPEVKKKWSDLKVQAKKRISAHRQGFCASGWSVGSTELSPIDVRLASIIEDMGRVLPPPDWGTDMAASIVVKPEAEELEDQKVSVMDREEVSGAAEEVAEEVAGGEEEMPELDDGAPGPSGVSGGRTSAPTPTDSALCTQRDLIQSIDNVTSELKHIGNVLSEISSTLKALVKTYTAVV